jgi:hypothetical protein
MLATRPHDPNRGRPTRLRFIVALRKLAEECQRRAQGGDARFEVAAQLGGTLAESLESADLRSMQAAKASKLARQELLTTHQDAVAQYDRLICMVAGAIGVDALTLAPFGIGVRTRVVRSKQGNTQHPTAMDAAGNQEGR